MPREDQHWWAEQIGRPIAARRLRREPHHRGCRQTHALVGEVWTIGDVVLRVEVPRIPCATFAEHMGVPQWVRRFTDEGRTGAYLSVVPPGPSGRALRSQVERPDHDIDLLALFRAFTGDLDAMRRVVEAGVIDAEVHADLNRPGPPRRLSDRRADALEGDRVAARHGTEWGMPPPPASFLPVPSPSGSPRSLWWAAARRRRRRSARPRLPGDGSGRRSSHHVHRRRQRRRPAPRRPRRPAATTPVGPRGDAARGPGGALVDRHAAGRHRPRQRAQHRRRVPRAEPGSGRPSRGRRQLPIERTSGEGGLLGLAVPEDFGANPVFYAYYSTDNDNRIAAVPWRGHPSASPGHLRRHPAAAATTTAAGSRSGRTATSTSARARPATPPCRRTSSRSAARSCASRPRASPLRATPSAAPPSGPTGTATCRGSPGTAGSACGPASSAPTRGTSSTSSSPVRTTAGRRSRDG